MNLRPLPCEGSALPLSYPPERTKNTPTHRALSRANLIDRQPFPHMLHAKGRNLAITSATFPLGSLLSDSISAARPGRRFAMSPLLRRFLEIMPTRARVGQPNVGNPCSGTSLTGLFLQLASRMQNKIAWHLAVAGTGTSYDDPDSVFPYRLQFVKIGAQPPVMIL